MTAAVRRILEMASRVLAFLRTHITEAVGDTNAIAQFETLVKRGEVLTTQQREGRIAARMAVVQRKQLRDQGQSNLLRFLVGVGVVASKDQPELIEQFRLPGKGATHQAFLTAMKGMLAKAASLRDLLVSRGMSESLLEDLGKAVTQFEASLEASSTGRRAHVGATADLEVVASEILEQVRMLDGLVHYRFGDNAELIAAWNSARNVLGPTKSRVTPPTPPPADQGAPSSPDSAAPTA